LAFGCRCGRSDRILVCSLVRTKMRPVLACIRPDLSRWHTARAGSQAFLSSSCRCLLSYTQTRVMWCTRCGGGVEGKPWSATIATHPSTDNRTSCAHTHQSSHTCVHTQTRYGHDPCVNSNGNAPQSLPGMVLSMEFREGGSSIEPCSTTTARSDTRTDDAMMNFASSALLDGSNNYHFF
jgi:hypothetical protein